jgi:hypothetical protein
MDLAILGYATSLWIDVQLPENRACRAQMLTVRHNDTTWYREIFCSLMQQLRLLVEKVAT